MLMLVLRLLIALHSEEGGFYATAENLYRKALDWMGASHRPPQSMESTMISLAYVCLWQGKWSEAEPIISPIAFENEVTGIAVYDALHALTLIHIKNSQLGNAERCCRRSLSGKEKILGKSDPSYWETLDLLASICDARNDPLGAEALSEFPSRCLLPSNRYESSGLPTLASRSRPNKTCGCRNRRTRRSHRNSAIRATA